MIDSDTQHANLNDLLLLYLDESAARLHQEQSPISPLSLRKLGDPISNPDEIFARHTLHLLLQFYSIIEIASLIRYVPAPLPQDFSVSAERRLSNPSVRKFYEDTSPLLLPQLFLRRLTQHQSIHEDPTLDLTPVYKFFGEFLSLVSQSRDDEEIGMFEWFLRYEHKGNLSLEDMIAVLAKPEELGDHFFKPPEERNELDLALRGFQSFVTLCLDFDNLLQRCTNFPLFQSALRHYFSFWFDHLGGKIEAYMNAATKALSSWAVSMDTPSPDIQPDRQDLLTYLQQIEFAIQRLIFGSYGLALHQVLEGSPPVPKNLLFVDNNGDFLETKKALLEGKEYHILTATTPEEARKALAEESISVAILDVRLQDDYDEHDFSGLRIALEANYPFPILLLTNNKDKTEIKLQQMTNERPGSSHIPICKKSETLENLLTKIREVEAAA